MQLFLTFFVFIRSQTSSSIVRVYTSSKQIIIYLNVKIYVILQKLSTYLDYVLGKLASNRVGWLVRRKTRVVRLNRIR